MAHSCPIESASMVAALQNNRPVINYHITISQQIPGHVVQKSQLSKAAASIVSMNMVSIYKCFVGSTVQRMNIKLADGMISQGKQCRHLRFDDIKIVAVISLLDDDFFGFDFPLKHGIKYLIHLKIEMVTM